MTRRQQINEFVLTNADSGVRRCVAIRLAKGELSGDVPARRGARHAWSNREGEPAPLAFALIDAEPV